MAAISRASTSAVKRAKAFFEPSGLKCVSKRVSQKVKRLDIPDEGVDLDGINIVKLLQCLLDLSLVGLDINNEHKGVVLLDLLHGALGVERVDDDLMLIESRLRRNRLSEVFWLAGELEGLGSVEGSRKTDLAYLLGVNLVNGQHFVTSSRRRVITYTLEGCLCSSIGLLATLGGLSSTCNHLRISNRS